VTAAEQVDWPVRGQGRTRSQKDCEQLAVALLLHQGNYATDGVYGETPVYALRTAHQPAGLGPQVVVEATLDRAVQQRRLSRLG
jgi:hypothetical protein